MSENRIGFIGLGEAASHISRGLLVEGVTDITAFDILPHPKQSDVTIVQSMEELVTASDIIFSAVTCTNALLSLIHI